LCQTTGTAAEVLFAPDYSFFTIDITFVAENGDEFFAFSEGSIADSAGRFC
jgi:hypothetical protein